MPKVFKMGTGGVEEFNLTLSKSFTITNPTATADRALWRVPENITIVAVHVLSDAVVVGQLWEYDANGLNGSTVGTDITTTANTNTDNGAMANTAIAAGNYLGWKTTTVSGSPTWVTITFEYY